MNEGWLGIKVSFVLYIYHNALDLPLCGETYLNAKRNAFPSKRERRDGDLKKPKMHSVTQRMGDKGFFIPNS